MEKYTIIMEYKGGTYIRQVDTLSLSEAIKFWAKNLDITEIKHMGEKTKQELINLLPEQLPILIEGLKNIWYLSFSLNGGFTTLHVIKTNNM